jgi:hypothetical protein
MPPNKALQLTSGNALESKSGSPIVLSPRSIERSSECFPSKEFLVQVDFYEQEEPGLGARFASQVEEATAVARRAHVFRERGS